MRLVSSAQGGGPTSGPGPGDGAVRWVRGPTFISRDSQKRSEEGSFFCLVYSVDLMEIHFCQSNEKKIL